MISQRADSVPGVVVFEGSSLDGGSELRIGHRQSADSCERLQAHSCAGLILNDLTTGDIEGPLVQL